MDMEDYTPPVVPSYGSAPDYGGLEPVAGLDASAPVPSWDAPAGVPAAESAPAAVQAAEGETSDAITLDFTGDGR